MPPWYPAPSHWTAKQRKNRTSLRHRMKTSLLPMLRGSICDTTCLMLTGIMEALEPLESKQVGPDLSKRVKAVVQRCADVSTSTGRKIARVTAQACAKYVLRGRTKGHCPDRQNCEIFQLVQGPSQIGDEKGLSQPVSTYHSRASPFPPVHSAKRGDRPLFRPRGGTAHDLLRA